MRHYDPTKGICVDEPEVWQPKKRVAKKLQRCYNRSDKPDKELFTQAYEKHIRNNDVARKKRLYQSKRSKRFQTRTRTT
jgi:hypothetical protein